MLLLISDISAKIKIKLIGIKMERVILVYFLQFEYIIMNTKLRGSKSHALGRIEIVIKRRIKVNM
jgi:hypothetical protein